MASSRRLYAPTRTVIVDHANEFTRVVPGDVPASERRALMRRVPHLLLADVVSRSASEVRWLRSTDIAAALVALALPARRAASVEPTVALRES